MQPVRHAGADVCYRGPTPDIGDLWCQREQPGLIRVVYELDDQEREQIAKGGRIPPISMQVIDEGMCRPVAEHPFKTIPELDDQARQPS